MFNENFLLNCARNFYVHINYEFYYFVYAEEPNSNEVKSMIQAGID